MKTILIKTTSEQIVEVEISEIYEALIKINELVEVRPNDFKDSDGNWYSLTKIGLKRKGIIE